MRQIISLLRFKERVGKCNCVDFGHCRIVIKIWIDVEEHRHINLERKGSLLMREKDSFKYIHSRSS